VLPGRAFPAVYPDGWTGSPKVVQCIDLAHSTHPEVIVPGHGRLRDRRGKGDGKRTSSMSVTIDEVVRRRLTFAGCCQANRVWAPTVSGAPRRGYT